MLENSSHHVKADLDVFLLDHLSQTAFDKRAFIRLDMRTVSQLMAAHIIVGIQFVDLAQESVEHIAGLYAAKVLYHAA